MDDDVTEGRRTEELLAALARRTSDGCDGCAAAVCGHAYVMSVALGFRDRPRCADCLAGALGHARAGFVERVYDYLASRPCYRAGWRWASRDEGMDEERPACVWPAR